MIEIELQKFRLPGSKDKKKRKTKDRIKVIDPKTGMTHYDYGSKDVKKTDKPVKVKDKKEKVSVKDKDGNILYYEYKSTKKSKKSKIKRLLGR